MIQSMTGFARLSRQTDLAQFTIELKAVNHRFLDLHLFLPESFSQLDLLWRNFLRNKLLRGRVDCSLRIQWHAKPQQGLPIDQPLLEQLLATTNRIAEKSPNVTAPSALELLKWPGVINPELLELGDLQQAIMNALQEACDILLNVRAQEGEAIKLLIEQRLKKIATIAADIHQQLPQLIELQKQRLLKKFEDASIQLEPERLTQEMVLFAQRMDVSEELDRLDIHLKAVQDLLNKGGNIGRKLDFMMQELNREANTLGSKSMSATVTQQVVAIKVCIEEMREQIQNIE